MAWEVRIVKDGNLFVGVEFRSKIEAIFIAADQKHWPGPRVGLFPCRSDGNEFDKEFAMVLQ